MPFTRKTYNAIFKKKDERIIIIAQNERDRKLKLCNSNKVFRGVYRIETNGRILPKNYPPPK